jgi:hypothetical protein
MSHWQRLAITGFVYATTLAVPLGLARRVAWNDAIGAIQADYMYHWIVSAQLGGPKSNGPSIIWLGDSTLLEGGRAKVAYPTLIAPELARRGVQSRIVAAPGLDSYGHYFLMGPVLALRPAAIVIVAHLRFLGDPDARSDDAHVTMNDLAGDLAPGDLPAALRLPLAERHLTVPRLLLAQLLKLRVVDDWFVFLQGLHRLAYTAVNGQPEAPWPQPSRAQQLLRDAYVEINAGSPGVCMLAAAVTKARSQGVPVLVIGTPVPIDLITATGRATIADVNADFHVIAEAVRDAGGTFLDLHDALRTSELLDNAGHFNAAGAARMAAFVAPEILRIVPDGGAERRVEPKGAKPSTS